MSTSAVTKKQRGTNNVVAPTGGRRRRNLAPLWMLSPAGLVIIAVTVAPIALLIGTSFTNYNQRSLISGEYQSVGLDNYTKLLTDPNFWNALLRTIVFTALLVIGSVLIGMAISHLLLRLGSVLRYVVTIVLILAWGMPNVASSLVWNWLFQPQYGVINWMLTQLKIFGDMTQTSWANSAGLAWLCIWLLIVWQAVPFIALTLYAAESQIPIDYSEAARLDGASEWVIYRHVTMPFLRPTLLLVTILSIIWDFNVFNQIWLVSQGGPDNATTTLGVYAYKTAFTGNQYALGSAAAVCTTILLVLLTTVYIRNLIRSGEDL